MLSESFICIYLVPNASKGQLFTTLGNVRLPMTSIGFIVKKRVLLSLMGVFNEFQNCKQCPFLCIITMTPGAPFTNMV